MQFSQVEANVAPSAAENLPAAQSKQVASGGREYLPAMQACAVAKRTGDATKRTARLAAARVIDAVVPLFLPSGAQLLLPCVCAADETRAVMSAIAVIQVVTVAEKAGSGTHALCRSCGASNRAVADLEDPSIML